MQASLVAPLDGPAERRNDMDGLTPKDHAETVAVFRSEVIGSLCRRELGHGDGHRAG